MALLPSGFALPPTPYLVVILSLAGIAAAALWLVRPDVNQAVVVAFAPWMVTGAALYALFQTGVFPPEVAPFFGSPAVYLTTFAVAGLMWAGLARYGFLAPVPLATVGTVTMLGSIGVALGVAVDRGSFAPFWPAVAVVVAAGLAAAVWTAADRVSVAPGDTGYVGFLAVLSHALDGVSTAVGHDVLGFGEQTPLSRAVLEAGAALPTAEAVGAGWLFVAVKVALALVVVVLLADLVRRDEREGYLALGVVAAVGLGPGAHNVVLFAIAG